MLTHDRRVTILALASGLPGVVISLLLLGYGGYSTLVRVTLAIVIIGLWFGLAALVRNRIVRPLQTVSNLLAALR
jgi:two-component system nitrogen regulation sensor histidine kinase NtrY